MNDQLELTRRTHAIAANINGRATDTGLAGNLRNRDSSGLSIHRLDEHADHDQAWHSWQLRGSALGAEDRLNNEFMTVFSHELRNSLMAVSGATYFLRTETTASPSAVKARLVIERQVGQMTRLVEDLLDMSRIRTGHLSLTHERTDLCAVVAHSVQAVEFTMQQRHHRMIASVPSAPIWLQADSARLQQVFVNLLVNAAKYTDDGGEIELSMGREADQAIVRIRDTGIGIAPDVLPHVFDLFIQADSSSRRADAGVGIGLALVRSLVEGHGGGISVTSGGLRQGSEFTVRLPMPAQ